MTKKRPERRARPPQRQRRQPGRRGPMRPTPLDEDPRWRPSDKLAGRAAIVTGGDSGIGRAVAILFAKEGADVCVAYLEEDRDAEETAARVRELGRRCVLARGDLGREAVAKRAVARAVRSFGRLDVVVNNCAEQHPTERPEDLTARQVERTFRTNVMSYFHVTRAALPHLGEGAAIVNSTSVTAYRGSHHLIDYASTKGAIVAFTRSLSQALAERGVRVNAVAPGPVWTPLIPASFPAEQVAKFGTKVPLGRAAHPYEIAPCYLFLASSDGAYMTGQVLHPNGGEIVNG